MHRFGIVRCCAQTVVKDVAEPILLGLLDVLIHVANFLVNPPQFAPIDGRGFPHAGHLIFVFNFKQFYSTEKGFA